MSRVPDQNWKSSGGGGGTMRPASSNSKVSKNQKNRINATQFIQVLNSHKQQFTVGLISIDELLKGMTKLHN